MKSDSTFDAIIFNEGLATRDLFENFSREILAIEEETEASLIERGVIQNAEQDVRGRMMQQSGKLIASGDACTVAICCR